MLREFADEIGKVHLPSVLFFAVEPLRMRRHASADRGDNALASDGPTRTGRPQALRRTQSQTFAVSSCTARIALDSNHAGMHALAACDAPLHHAAPAAARGLRPRKACKTPGGARNREPSGLCGGGRTNSPVRLDVRAHLLAEGDASLVIAAHLPLTQPLRPPPSSSGNALFSSEKTKIHSPAGRRCGNLIGDITMSALSAMVPEVSALGH